MLNGDLTARIARSLQEEFNRKKFDINVLHDHRQNESDLTDKAGKLRSWFGPKPKPEFETLLSDLDIAIVSRSDNKVYALIEIEETTDKPKVILGDVFAALLGSGIAFQGNYDFKVGEYTTLIVMVADKNESHSKRLIFLNEQIAILKEKLITPNAKIKRIIVVSYKDEAELKDRLMPQVYEAIG